MLEFLRGSRSTQEYNRKKEFVESIVDNIFSIKESIEEDALKLSLLYLSPGGTTSVTDFYLAATLITLKSPNIFLMTKNHKDFPTTLFDRANTFLFHNERDVQTFCLYSINRNKYNELLEKIL